MTETLDKRERKPNLAMEGAVEETILTIQQSRAGYAAALTREKDSLSQLLSNVEYSSHRDIETQTLKVECALKKLQSRNNDLIAKLSDLGDINDANMYFDRYQTAAVHVITSAKQACDQMVEPDDSVSHHSSNASTNVSSISSARAKAIAKKNALLARAQFLDKVQELESRSLEAEKRRNIEREFDKLQLSQQLEKIKLKADIAAAEAENALADIDNAEINGHHATINVPVPAETKPLNPLASEWVQTLARPSNFVSNQEILGSPSAMSGTGSENGQSKLSDQGSSVSAGSVGFLQQQQRELIETLRLPTSQLMSYSGDPLQYWMFMQSYDHMVGNTSVSHAAKLNRLLQCCTGKAFKVTECCAMMDPVTGYAKARSLLKQRFGNDFRISESWIQKIVDKPAIKPQDGSALQDLADDVRSCKETLEAMGRLSEIDTRVRMVKILDRLPLFLQARWRHEAVREADNTGVYPGILRLVDFLDSAAR